MGPRSIPSTKQVFRASHPEMLDALVVLQSVWELFSWRDLGTAHGFDNEPFDRRCCVALGFPLKETYACTDDAESEMNMPATQKLPLELVREN